MSHAEEERNRTVLDGLPAEFTCIDISESAISTLVDRFPEVSGVVADARAIPLESESYDVAASQFGIEYAGLEAIDEMLSHSSHDIVAAVADFEEQLIPDGLLRNSLKALP